MRLKHITYEYDLNPNGNQTKKTIGANTWDWVYDAENRMIEYDDPVNTNDTTYTYDALNRRISRTNTLTLTSERYLYDGANVIADYELQSEIWNLKSSYLTPFTDQNLIVTRYSPLATNYYYMQDGLGSVRSVLDSAQSVVNSYDYNAFGESLSATEGVTNRYKYTGREWDTESAHYYYRARHYNPATGRFIGRDQIGYLAGLNLYTYCLNNPVTYIDPFGLEGEILTVTVGVGPTGGGGARAGSAKVTASGGGQVFIKAAVGVKPGSTKVTGGAKAEAKVEAKASESTKAGVSAKAEVSTSTTGETKASVGGSATASAGGNEVSAGGQTESTVDKNGKLTTKNEVSVTGEASSGGEKKASVGSTSGGDSIIGFHGAFIASLEIELNLTELAIAMGQSCGSGTPDPREFNERRLQEAGVQAPIP